MDENTVLAALKSYGANVDAACERFMGDVELYITCLNSFFEDKNFELLRSSLDKGDAPQAFFAAHTLKGVAGNLGLTPMYDIICEIVEPLRAGSCEGLESKLSALESDLKALKSALGE